MGTSRSSASRSVAAKQKVARQPRRRKFTPYKKQALVELVWAGNTITSICESMGIDSSTYRKARGEDPDFAREVDVAREGRGQLVEDALYVTAMAGNVAAQIFYLCNRHPERWQNVQRREATYYDQNGVPVRVVEIVTGRPGDGA